MAWQLFLHTWHHWLSNIRPPSLPQSPETYGTQNSSPSKDPSVLNQECQVQPSEGSQNHISIRIPSWGRRLHYVMEVGNPYHSPNTAMTARLRTRGPYFGLTSRESFRLVSSFGSFRKNRMASDVGVSPNWCMYPKDVGTPKKLRVPFSD